MLANEIVVLNADSPLWRAAQPLLNAALKLDQYADTYSWHGWDKRQISHFLKNLPSPCSLVAGVWETMPVEDATAEREELALGIVCEVVEGEIRSIRTFEALASAGLKPIKELEPGIDDALEIMRAARKLIAPVAWALFIERTTWNEWLFAAGDDETVVNKGELLASYARQGRCVLMGNQTAHPHSFS
ncbi:MAG TPA: hypothetical protein VJ761_11660 [Ktedonobacteraceae bacterium]|nr:hypothetical protein [Ktedonobacteraceae bacterium]